MRNPAEIALRRPRVVALFTVLCVLYGVISFTLLPRQENPDIQDRHVEIRTYYPGADPEKVELLVSKVLETAVAEVDDLESILNESTTGRSWFLIQIKKGAPLAKRKQDIEDKVQQVRPELPAGITGPEVYADTLHTNTMLLTLAGADLPPLALREHAKTLRRRIENLSAVRRVELLGESEEEIAVEVDLRKLSQNGLPLTAVVRALETRNTLLPGGELEGDEQKSTIRTTGAFTAVADVGNTYLGASPEGLPIRLADVGTVTRRLAEPDVLVRTNGTPAVSLAVEMLPERNAIQLGEQVRILIGQLAPTLPEGVEIHVVADEPTYVSDRLRQLTTSLLLGMVLVVGLIMLGMGWRSGLIVSCSIPLSLIVAMGGLELAGVALHQISIAALVIAIGIVVDEAIVVTDNIQRHLELGRTPSEAAIQGLGEIHLAILAGAFTTIAAFIPLALMSGDIGDFIRSIPVAVSIMILASVIVAHFVTPLLAAGLQQWARAHGIQPRTEAHRFEPHYRRVVGFVVQHHTLVLVAFIGGLVLSGLVLRAVLWPPQFFPAADRHQFLIEASLPMGSPVEQTDSIMREIEARLDAEPQVDNYTAYIGAGAPKFYYNEFTEGQSENQGMFIVNTRTDLPLSATPKLARSLDRELQEIIAGARVRTKVLKQGYGGGGGDVDVYITGDDLNVLRALSARIRDVVSTVPGVAEAEDKFGYDPITLEARVDDAKANLLGIAHADVATTLRTALDGVTATTFREGDEEIDVTVRLPAHERADVTDVRSVPVYSPTSGRAVPLSQVASIEPAWTTRMITRWKRKREAQVEADIVGRPLADVEQDIRRALLEQVPLPEGYEYTFEGEIKELWESFASLAKAGLVAIFLIYIILVVQFNSLMQPALIILAIPMSLIGAVWGLVLTGNDLGFMAFVGFIALTGIVVNDSIVLLDYINTLRRRGLDLESAVSRGATTRLRAVVLTSVTTIGGLLPLSLTGGSFWQPFGVAMIFGLAASTFLTLLVQPAAYLTLERYRKRRAAARGDAASAEFATATTE